MEILNKIITEPISTSELNLLLNSKVLLKSIESGKEIKREQSNTPAPTYKFPKKLLKEIYLILKLMYT
jgi:hypothetical protein